LLITVAFFFRTRRRERISHDQIGSF